MIDFHSHILPAIDDGSQSVEESVQLLKILAAQGVDTVAATPHFYPNRRSVEAFLEKRQSAYERLRPALFEGAPNILLGAEVRYYEGIERMPQLLSLCLEGTKLLLVEMPSNRWTEYAVRELVHLASSGKVTVVLAHIERYLSQQSADVWRRLVENGVLMQVNATFFTGFATRRKALRLLKERFIRLIGSDCHGVDVRPPCMDQAFARIEKKLGKEYALRFVGDAEKIVSANRVKTESFSG